MRNYFPSLLGNQDIKLRIGRAIENGTVAHAFLISGPSGSGKSTLATELAAAMNCIEKNNSTKSLPCGVCDSCRRIREGIYPDVRTLHKAKDKATLGVDLIKDFREDMFLSSTESDYKIYVIDDAECMTPEAQNALLKVLEEPPSSVMIILLAKECDRILTTIKSRAQFVAMSRFDDQSLAEQLLKESAEARALKVSDEERFKGIIMSSDGRLGLAKKLVSKRLAEENGESRADIIRIIKATSGRVSYKDLYSAISSLPTKRAELTESLERMMNALRDLIVIKYDKNAKTLFFSSHDEAIKCCGDISVGKLLAIYDEVNETHSLCARNANISNLLSSLCSGIRIIVSKRVK